MVDQRRLESIFLKFGFDDFKWICPEEIIMGQWVRFKCMFGCPEYGKNGCCPPDNVPSVSECRAFVQEYGKGVIFHLAKHVDKPEDRVAWSRKIHKKLSDLEREVFLSGYHKVFVLPIDNCLMCRECNKDRKQCVHPGIARPTAEALGIDVYGTVRRFGFPVHVLPDYSQTMNRYAFLLVE